jgi:hypothetical protein
MQRQRKDLVNIWSTTKDNMKANLFLLAAIMMVSTASCKNASNDKPNFSKRDNVVGDSTLGKLIEDVLNIPSVVKLSKADRIRKEYGILNVSLADNSAEIGDSILYQKGSPIKVIKNEKIGADTPCYLFEKLEVQGQSAYISMKFEITGFVCRGKLNYVEGRWVPEKDFLVGYR